MATNNNRLGPNRVRSRRIAFHAPGKITRRFDIRQWEFTLISLGSFPSQPEAPAKDVPAGGSMTGLDTIGTVETALRSQYHEPRNN